MAQVLRGLILLSESSEGVHFLALTLQQTTICNSVPEDVKYVSSLCSHCMHVVQRYKHRKNARI